MKIPTVIRITPTDDDIELATRGNPGGCVFANAIGRTYPTASNVLVADDYIAFSDREARQRYFWATPPEVTAYLQDWDTGGDPTPPTLVLSKKSAFTKEIKPRSIKEKAKARAYAAKLKQRIDKETPAETKERQRNQKARQRHIRRSGA